MKKTNGFLYLALSIFTFAVFSLMIMQSDNEDEYEYEVKTLDEVYYLTLANQIQQIEIGSQLYKIDKKLDLIAISSLVDHGIFIDVPVFKDLHWRDYGAVKEKQFHLSGPVNKTLCDYINDEKLNKINKFKCDMTNIPYFEQQ